jgi:hypothetical protein
MFDQFFQGDLTPQPMDYRLVALSLLLSFLCGHVVAWLYAWTHNGLSYSRSFVKSLVVLPVIVAFVLMVLSNNLVTAFGLMAVLAIVRFRNVLRDTLDTTYLLAGIVLGMACGTQRYTTAVIGCALTATIFIYLWFTDFGTRHSYDVILNVNWTRPTTEIPELSAALQRHARTLRRASQQASGAGGTDLSYRILMRDASRVEEMVDELRGLTGVARVFTIAAENESEV